MNSAVSYTTSSLQAKRLLLFTLLLVDLTFIGLHFYNSLIPDEQWSPKLSLVNDSSIAELFQYIKWFLIAVLFLIMAVKRNAFSYISWALFFTYFLLDDALEIHEKLGAYVVQNTNMTAPFGLRLQDIGELAVTAIAGSTLFLSLFWAYRKGGAFFRKISQSMLLLIFALVGFGVGVDMLHEISHPGKLLNFIFEVVEDGGEMFVASFMLWYVVLISDFNDAPPSLLESIRGLNSFSK